MMIIDVIKSYRYNLANEQVCKDGIEHVLKKNEISYKREYRLDAKNIPDFFQEETGIAVEVKIKCSAAAALRQCKRYAKFEQVKAIVFVTNTAHGFPPEVEGKPVYFISLGKSWLFR